MCFQATVLFPSATFKFVVSTRLQVVEMVSGSNILAVSNISNARNAMKMHHCYVLHIISCKWVYTTHHIIVFHQLFHCSRRPTENRLGYLSHSVMCYSRRRSQECTKLIIILLISNYLHISLYILIQKYFLCSILPSLYTIFLSITQSDDHSIALHFVECMSCFKLY